MKFKTVPFAGQKWEQHWVRPTHKAFEGDQCHGTTNPETCKVYFSNTSPEPVFETTYCHENLGHVAFYVSGVTHMILELFEGDQEAADKWEEEAIRKLELVWYPFLKLHNFQFPKPATKAVKE